MKSLLLTEDQLKLFDYLPKPNIPVSEQFDTNEEQIINYFKEDKPFRA